jgi:acyl-CoA thioester hydrolase
MPAHLTVQKLRFCDTDQLGHVNNAVYSVMCEAGRAELFTACGLCEPGGPIAPVIVRLELDFVREMNWPGEVEIASIITRIGTKSVHVAQTLTLAGEFAARAVSVLAMLDTRERRAVPITPEWRAALSRFASREASA